MLVSRNTLARSRSLVMAFFGHTAMQGGSTHCWHVKGTKKFPSPAPALMTSIRFLAIFRYPVCLMVQAISHSLQPLHLKGSMRRTLDVTVSSHYGPRDRLSIGSSSVPLFIKLMIIAPAFACCRPVFSGVSGKPTVANMPQHSCVCQFFSNSHRTVFQFIHDRAR